MSRQRRTAPRVRRESCPRAAGWRPVDARLAVAAVAAAVLSAAACDRNAEIAPPAPLSGQSGVEYPAELWEEGVEGVTVLRILVNEDGGVDSVLVAEGSGHGALDSAAARGARRVRFAPALSQGIPIRVWARLPVRFSRSFDSLGGADRRAELGESALAPVARGGSDASRRALQ